MMNASRYNISISSIVLRGDIGNDIPQLKIKFPDNQRYLSKEPITSDNKEHIFQDKPIFSYYSNNNIRLSRYFMRISVRSKNRFIGDVEIDLLTLVTSPNRFELNLEHGIEDCKINFVLFCEEFTYSKVIINNLTIENVDLENYEVVAYLSSKPDKVKNISTEKINNKIKQINDITIEDQFCYKELMTDIIIEIYDKNSKILYDKKQFDIRNLYIKNKSDYLNYTDIKKNIIIFNLSLINKPIYIQGISGIYQGFGRYINYKQVNGCYVMGNKRRHAFKFNEPITQPSEGARRTFKPFIFKIKIEQFKITGENIPNNIFIKSSNTLNTLNDELLFEKHDDYFLLIEEKQLKELSTYKPYQLTRRYLIFTLVNDNDETLGDIYLNLHDIFSGPPTFIIDFMCIDGIKAKAEIVFNIISGRSMQVKFTDFETNYELPKNCVIKFGLKEEEILYDNIENKDNKYIIDGDYDIVLHYTTVSKNIKEYQINLSICERTLLGIKPKFNVSVLLITLLPFKNKKEVNIILDNDKTFKCTLYLSTSENMTGLYGEYVQLDSGVYNNGHMNLSEYKEPSMYTEFCQPFYFRTIRDISPKNTDNTEENNDNIKCSVLSGINKNEKIYLQFHDKELIVNDINNNEILKMKLDASLLSDFNNNQLTLISPKYHIHLYTNKSNKIKKFIDDNTIDTIDNNCSKEDDRKYFCLCSNTCKGAINITCPLCYFHPIDFTLYNYNRVYCDECGYETKIHYIDNQNIDINCPKCKTLLLLSNNNDELQKTFVCSCGYEYGSYCKSCKEIPEFNAPTIYIRKKCSGCNDNVIINESIKKDLKCIKCNELFI